ncbi:MAG TPA: hypothetical protein PLO67_19245 [Saprospiraceae bacterium]|nr:hypothetical protein [Saprospiraceae bacterium]HPI08254.1 hypothetical protein [Saprospiraceae bacterium]
MLNRKLLEVLSRLDNIQRKKLRLFLQSPYFNNQQQVETLALYDYIIEYDAVETDPMLDKAWVFARFFPDKRFEEGKKNSLDGLMSRLFGLVRTFLTHEHIERDAYEKEYDEQFALLRFYRKYALEDRFWQVVQAIKALEKERPYQDAQFYHRQFKLAEEIAAFRTLANTWQDDANIGTASHYLDIHYSLLRVEIICALRYQRYLSQSDAQDDQFEIEQVLALAKSGNFEHLPLLQLYLLVFRLLASPDEEQTLKEFEILLEQTKSELPLDILSNLKAYQRYFWIRRYTTSGDPFYRHKLFDLYKEHFEAGYFYVEGSISVTALRMLVIFALKLGQFDWVKKVLDQHPPERICGTRYPAEAYNLNLAEYYFYIKQYPKAVEKLQYRLFENPNLSILVDVLLIKIYVETWDELLDSRMKALEQKVRRIKVSTVSKTRYTNFLKKLDKIIRHVWQKKSSRFEKMTRELKSIPQIIEREWLLEKLEERAK